MAPRRFCFAIDRDQAVVAAVLFLVICMPVSLDSEQVRVDVYYPTVFAQYDKLTVTEKTTLAREYARTASVPHVTLDNATQLAAASSDAHGFLSGVGGRVIAHLSMLQTVHFVYRQR